MLVRGYDALHRLQHGRQTQTYLNAKDSDIAQAVAGRAGLEVGPITETTEVHPWVPQANQSDWEFLTDRARQIGFELSVDDGALQFRKPTPASDAPEDGDYDSSNPLQLVFGQNLLQFRPRITAAEQVGSVEVHGWDPVQAAALNKPADPATTSVTLGSLKPDEIAAGFNPPAYVLIGGQVATEAGLDAASAAVSEQLASAFVEAEGTARGHPGLKAGVAVSVSAVADQFAGKYSLSQTRHVFDEDGYRTEFRISGGADRSLLGLALAGPSASGAIGGSARSSSVGGLVIALVTENDDPEGLGRVKLKFPWLADTFESDWAPVTQFGAGPDSGSFFVPNVGDEVLVGFGFGDIRQPFVIGGLHNGQTKHMAGEIESVNGAQKRRGIVSRNKHHLTFFDGADESGISLITGQNHLRISLDDTQSWIELNSPGKVTISADGDMQLTAKGSLELSGSAGLKLKSDAVVEVSGQTIKLN